MPTFLTRKLLFGSSICLQEQLRGESCDQDVQQPPLAPTDRQTAMADLAAELTKLVQVPDFAKAPTAEKENVRYTLTIPCCTIKSSLP